MLGKLLCITWETKAQRHFYPCKAIIMKFFLSVADKVVTTEFKKSCQASIGNFKIFLRTCLA